MIFDGWFPKNVSTFGGEIDFVFYLIFYIVGFWFLLTEGLIIYSIIRHRGQNRKATFFDGNTKLQAAWILVPAAIVLILDLGIDFAGGKAYDKVKIEKPHHVDLEVEVIAKQYGWMYHYPGDDGVLGTKDDIKLEEGTDPLHVPVNKVIQVYLRSEDVIHSFFVPSLRLKQDIVPGRRIPVWFEVTETGEYTIVCAELCGFSHHTMQSSLIVESQDQFDKWLKEESEFQW